jgi:hypothetical protein
MSIKFSWPNRVLAIFTLVLIVLLAGSRHPSAVIAADQNAAVLQAIQGLQSSVNDLRARQITQSADIKAVAAHVANDHELMLKRTGAAQDTAKQALAGLADVDAGHEASTIVQQDTRLTTIETLFKAQRDQEKLDNDAAEARSNTEMRWLEVLVAALLPIGIGFILHGRQMSRVEKSTDGMTKKLVAAEKKVSRGEGVTEGRESERAGE